jgi:hypothetical protein
MSEIKIGDAFFIFDENRRVYVKGQSGPTFRGHFSPCIIKGETSRSWITTGHYGVEVKIPKSDPWRLLYTEEMIIEKEWAQTHRHRIQSKIMTASVSQLRKTAEILEYVS